MFFRGTSTTPVVVTGPWFSGRRGMTSCALPDVLWTTRCGPTWNNGWAPTSATCTSTTTSPRSDRSPRSGLGWVLLADRDADAVERDYTALVGAHRSGHGTWPCLSVGTTGIENPLRV